MIYLVLNFPKNFELSILASTLDVFLIIFLRFVVGVVSMDHFELKDPSGFHCSTIRYYFSGF